MKFAWLVVTMVLLLQLILPAAAQADRCVENPYKTGSKVAVTPELELLRLLYQQGNIYPEELRRLRELEYVQVPWTERNGVGNGWLAGLPNSCVLYTASSDEAVMGTWIYRLESGPAASALPPATGEHGAVVIDGPAYIRSGPGLEHSHHRWCITGWSLTVWTPAQNGWLRASCYGGDGWIHESVVRIGDGTGQIDPAPAAVSDIPSAASGQQAVVTDGPARIRSGPGLEHSHVRWCDQGLPLTVWLPAVDGWLRASCYRANGWIHESLVQILD